MLSLNSVEMVTQMPEEGVFLLRCNITDIDDIIRDCDYCSRPDDPYGLNPTIRQWLADNPSFPRTPYVPPAVPEAVTIVYPVDLWSRMTDAEADAVEAAMAAQTVRIQNIFKFASSYRSDHELWPLLTGMTAELFGASRAAEILAAS